MDEDLEKDTKSSYMTVEQFLTAVSPGLFAYLEDNLGFSSTPRSELHHPLDLINSAQIYFEVMGYVVGDLGVSSNLKNKSEEL